MPNCQIYRHWMSLKLDGLLTEEQEQALQSHLVACAACRAEWEALQLVSAFLTRQSMISAPTGFVVQVQNRLVEEKAIKKRKTVGATALALGTSGLVTLVFFSLIELVIKFWPLLSRPSMWESLGSWLTRFADVGLAVGNAIALLLGSLFDRVGGPTVLVYMLAALLLTFLGSQVMFRRVRAYQPIHH